MLPRSFNNYFRLHVVCFALSCCYQVSFLVCNLYQCCFGVQVIFTKHLAPIEQVTDGRRMQTFLGGVLAATSSLPYNSTLGDVPQRGSHQQKRCYHESWHRRMWYSLPSTPTPTRRRREHCLHLSAAAPSSVVFCLTVILCACSLRAPSPCYCWVNLV